MDERDKVIQELRRTNIALLGELHAIKECFTCSHYGEMTEHCDTYMFGNDCRDYQYEWRGVQASEEWQAEQEQIRETEARLKAIADEEEDKFERRLDGRQ